MTDDLRGSSHDIAGGLFYDKYKRSVLFHFLLLSTTFSVRFLVVAAINPQLGMLITEI